MSGPLIATTQPGQLLGPNGAPIQASYAIPFVRIYPDGKRGLQTIDRGEALYTLACKFIAGGGRLGICINEDGTVDMVGVLNQNGDDVVAAQEIAQNDASLLQAVDKLVHAAVSSIADMPAAEPEPAFEGVAG